MSGINLSPEERQIWRIVNAVIQINQGRNDAGGTVTLRANQTTTVVEAPNCGKDSRVKLTPNTSNAAAALGTTYIKRGDVVAGGFTITHASAASTDRDFWWEATG